VGPLTTHFPILPSPLSRLHYCIWGGHLLQLQLLVSSHRHPFLYTPHCLWLDSLWRLQTFRKNQFQFPNVILNLLSLLKRPMMDLVIIRLNTQMDKHSILTRLMTTPTLWFLPRMISALHDLLLQYRNKGIRFLHCHPSLTSSLLCQVPREFTVFF
jgi:hypothetical protein